MSRIRRQSSSPGGKAKAAAVLYLAFTQGAGGSDGESAFWGDPMARHINQEIRVSLTRDPQWNQLRPEMFIWRRQRFQVTRVLERWSEVGRWWEGEVPATIWRLEVKGGGVYELAAYQQEPVQWRLMVIYD